MDPFAATSKPSSSSPSPPPSPPYRGRDAMEEQYYINSDANTANASPVVGGAGRILGEITTVETETLESWHREPREHQRERGPASAGGGGGSSASLAVVVGGSSFGAAAYPDGMVNSAPPTPSSLSTVGHRGDAAAEDSVWGEGGAAMAGSSPLAPRGAAAATVPNHGIGISSRATSAATSTARSRFARHVSPHRASSKNKYAFRCEFLVEKEQSAHEDAVNTHHNPSSNHHRPSSLSEEVTPSVSQSQSLGSMPPVPMASSAAPRPLSSSAVGAGGGGNTYSFSRKVPSTPEGGGGGGGGGGADRLRSLLPPDMGGAKKNPQSGIIMADGGGGAGFVGGGPPTPPLPPHFMQQQHSSSQQSSPPRGKHCASPPAAVEWAVPSNVDSATGSVIFEEGEGDGDGKDRGGAGHHDLQHHYQHQRQSDYPPRSAGSSPIVSEISQAEYQLQSRSGSAIHPARGGGSSGVRGAPSPSPAPSSSGASSSSPSPAAFAVMYARDTSAVPTRGGGGESTCGVPTAAAAVPSPLPTPQPSLLPAVTLARRDDAPVSPQQRHYHHTHEHPSGGAPIARSRSPHAMPNSGGYPPSRGAAAAEGSGIGTCMSRETTPSLPSSSSAAAYMTPHERSLLAVLKAATAQLESLRNEEESEGSWGRTERTGHYGGGGGDWGGSRNLPSSSPSRYRGEVGQYSATPTKRPPPPPPPASAPPGNGLGSPAASRPTASSSSSLSPRRYNPIDRSTHHQHQYDTSTSASPRCDHPAYSPSSSYHHHHGTSFDDGGCGTPNPRASVSSSADTHAYRSPLHSPMGGGATAMREAPPPPLPPASPQSPSRYSGEQQQHIRLPPLPPTTTAASAAAGSSSPQMLMGHSLSSSVGAGGAGGSLPRAAGPASPYTVHSATATAVNGAALPSIPPMTPSLMSSTSSMAHLAGGNGGLPPAMRGSASTNPPPSLPAHADNSISSNSAVNVIDHAPVVLRGGGGGGSSTTAAADSNTTHTPSSPFTRDYSRQTAKDVAFLKAATGALHIVGGGGAGDKGGGGIFPHHTVSYVPHQQQQFYAQQQRSLAESMGSLEGPVAPPPPPPPTVPATAPPLAVAPPLASPQRPPLAGSRLMAAVSSRDDGDGDEAVAARGSAGIVLPPLSTLLPPHRSKERQEVLTQRLHEGRSTVPQSYLGPMTAAASARRATAAAANSNNGSSNNGSPMRRTNSAGSIGGGSAAGKGASSFADGTFQRTASGTALSGYPSQLRSPLRQQQQQPSPARGGGGGAFPATRNGYFVVTNTSNNTTTPMLGRGRGASAEFRSRSEDAAHHRVGGGLAVAGGGGGRSTSCTSALSSRVGGVGPRHDAVMSTAVHILGGWDGDGRSASTSVLHGVSAAGAAVTVVADGGDDEDDADDYNGDGGHQPQRFVKGRGSKDRQASINLSMATINANTGRPPFTITLWDGRYQNSTNRKRVVVHPGCIYLTQITERVAVRMGCAPAAEVLFTPMGHTITRIDQLEPDAQYLILPAGCGYRADTVPVALLQRLVVARDLLLMGRGAAGPAAGVQPRRVGACEV